jgi:hypothetical protein
MTGILSVLSTTLCAVLLLAPSQENRGRAAEAEALPADLDLVPRDAYGFASVRLADLWQSAAGAELRKTLTAQRPDVLKSVEKALGITLADIERGTIVGKGPKLGSVGILAATKPLDRASILATFGAEGFEEKKIQGGRYYEEPGPGAVIYFHGERIFLITPFAVEKVKKGAGKEYLDWTAVKRADGPLAAPLALAAGKHHVTVALLPSAVQEWVGDVPAQYRLVEPLLLARYAVATAHFNQEALTSRCSSPLRPNSKRGPGRKLPRLRCKCLMRPSPTQSRTLPAARSCPHK